MPGCCVRKGRLRLILPTSEERCYGDGAAASPVETPKGAPCRLGDSASVHAFELLKHETAAGT